MQLVRNGALRRMVAGGLGVRILSTWVGRSEIDSGNLHQPEVEGFPVCRAGHMIWSCDRSRSLAAQALPDHLHGKSWRRARGVSLGAQ